MTRTINLRGIPEDLFRDFKIACVSNDADMSSVLRRLMGDYVRSGGKVAGDSVVKAEQAKGMVVKQDRRKRGK